MKLLEMARNFVRNVRLGTATELKFGNKEVLIARGTHGDGYFTILLPRARRFGTLPPDTVLVPYSPERGDVILWAEKDGYAGLIEALQRSQDEFLLWQQTPRAEAFNIEVEVRYPDEKGSSVDV